MKHRFHAPGLTAESEMVSLAGDELHHAVRVSRVRAGEEIELFDGRGFAVGGIVREITRESATVEVLSPVADRESRCQLILAAALIHPDRYELVLQKATELGVQGFIPLLTSRTEVRIERVRGKEDRWNKIILEAVKQSGRSRIPPLHPPEQFVQVVRRPEPKILFEGEQDPPEAWSWGGIERVILLVGPEGGWSEEEIAEGLDQGCRLHRLGPRRLRAETASISALTWAQLTFGDFLRPE